MSRVYSLYISESLAVFTPHSQKSLHHSTGIWSGLGDGQSRTGLGQRCSGWLCYVTITAQSSVISWSSLSGDRSDPTCNYHDVMTLHIIHYSVWHSSSLTLHIPSSCPLQPTQEKSIENINKTSEDQNIASRWRWLSLPVTQDRHWPLMSGSKGEGAVSERIIQYTVIKMPAIPQLIATQMQNLNISLVQNNKISLDSAKTGACFI